VASAKQIVPRRVGNFVEPLSIISEELMSHLDRIKDDSGNIEDVKPELYKWAFQGACIVSLLSYLLFYCTLKSLLGGSEWVLFLKLKISY